LNSEVSEGNRELPDVCAAQQHLCTTLGTGDVCPSQMHRRNFTKAGRGSLKDPKYHHMTVFTL